MLASEKKSTFRSDISDGTRENSVKTSNDVFARASKWVLVRKAGDAAALGRTLGISAVFARVLINRGLINPKDAAAYINPALSPDISSITRLGGVIEAYALLKEFLSEPAARKVCIYGDYDADGVTSTVILYKTLLAFGADVFFYIPDREEEGYGLNADAVKRVHEAGAGFLLTCDNGIASVEEIALAKELGMRVVILDHHELGASLPNADAVVDPKLKGQCPYGYENLCAGGLAYLFALGFFAYMRTPPPANCEAEFLQLATIATFCDVVDLTGQNRVIAKAGLVSINEGFASAGLSELAKTRSLKKRITDYEIGYIIGPCINATGRLETAEHAVRLLLTDDRVEAASLGAHLAQLNDKRKEMTKKAVAVALAEITGAGAKDMPSYGGTGKPVPYNVADDGAATEAAAKEASAAAPPPQDRVIVYYNPDIHESIAGIVAGRIRDKLNRPVIVLTASAKEGVAKGSARSTPPYDMFAALSENAALFMRFGGHPMAAGLTLPERNITELRARLNDNCTLTEDELTRKIYIDKQLKLGDITYTLANELEVMSPFGKANSAPVFGTLNASVIDLRVSLEKNYIRFVFAEDGTSRRVTGVCFGMVEEFIDAINAAYPPDAAAKILRGVLREARLCLDIVYTIEINEYNNDVSVQLKIIGFRVTGGTP